MNVIGCVGCGNMGGAILAGLADRLPQDVFSFCGFNRTAARMLPLGKKGVQVKANALEVAQAADILILAVKPYQVDEVLAQMRRALSQDKILISVAAGVSCAALERATEGACAAVRCMPNTPALVGRGVFALCFGSLPQEKRAVVLSLFSSLGLCVEIPEERFTAFSAWIGAGPAYVFQMMQGMAQAGVTLGFQHKEARQMVAALFAGSAAMAEVLPEPFAQMRDQVCSPGGLTIVGVNHLDRAGLGGLLVEAVLAADAKGRSMER